MSRPPGCSEDAAFCIVNVILLEPVVAMVKVLNSIMLHDGYRRIMKLLRPPNFSCACGALKARFWQLGFLRVGRFLLGTCHNGKCGAVMGSEQPKLGY